MNKHGFRTWLALAVAVAAIGAGATLWTVRGPLAAHSTPSSGAPAKSLVYTASWPRAYAGIADLARAADVVVVGTVTGSQPFTETIGNKYPTTIHETNFNVSVSRVLKGSASQGSSITVRQTGGGGAQVSDDPSFVNGATYLLFMSYSESQRVYTVLSGPFGRFVVNGDTVEDLHHAYPALAITDTNVNGISLDQVQTEVATAG